MASDFRGVETVNGISKLVQLNPLIYKENEAQGDVTWPVSRDFWALGSHPSTLTEHQQAPS